MQDTTGRRTLTQTLLAVPALISARPLLAAAPWPSRPLRVIVGFPPGQSMDVLPRAMAEAMSRRIGQPVVIENRAGGVGVPAVEALIRSVPDGHTLAVGVPSTLVVNPVLMPNLSYAPTRDVVPVARLFDVAVVVSVHAAVPVRTPAEFVAWLRANPGTRYASAGPATSPHLAAELFARRLGLSMEHVAYRGSAGALADVAAGVVPVMFDSAPPTLAVLPTGRIRLVAVTAPARLYLLPDTPTVAESLIPGFEAAGWAGLVAPRGTPTTVTEAINVAVRGALEDTGVGERFAALGAVPRPGTSAEFDAFIGSEREKWGDVLRTARIRLDG